MNEEVTTEEVNGTDADFDSGFEQAEQTPTPEIADETPKVEAAPEPKLAQITEDQFNDLMAKAASVDEIKAESQRKFDHAFGQLGGMKQIIERLQQSTPQGQSITVTDADFSELSSEFPELAAMQIKGLNKVLSKLGGTAPAVDTSLIERMVQERVGQVAREARENALDGLHNVIPDWQEEVRKPAFTEWLDKQDAQTKALASSDRVVDASRMLRMYRNSRPAPQKPQITTRQRQLEAAVTPRGRGQAPAPVEDDDFEAGFNSR